MSSIKYNDLSVFIAEQFLEAVSEPSAANLYLVFGKTDAWANDANPDAANTMPLTFNEVWNNAVGAKKISGFDISHVIPYYTWSANTVYTQYDQRNPNLYLPNTKFYVVTSDYKVFKCLYNANNSNSRVEPTEVSTNTAIQTSDGYIWKYMYTVDGRGQLKFTTDDYVPVQALTGDNGTTQWSVQSDAVEGAIYVVVIENGGVGYSNVANLTFNLVGDGIGANLSLGVNTTSNTINTATMTNYGSGYHRATITVLGGGGTGAILRPLLSPPGGHGSSALYELGGNQVIVNVRINNSGSVQFSVGNDIRQMAIVKDPFIWDTTNVASNTVISQTYDLTLTGSGADYELDEIVYQGDSLELATFSGRVYDYNAANGTMKLINTKNDPTNETLIGANSTASKFISSITTPGLEKYTGKLLYVNNIGPIVRHEDQVEDIKIVITL